MNTAHLSQAPRSPASPMRPLALPRQGAPGEHQWRVVLQVLGQIWFPTWEGWAPDSMEATRRAVAEFRRSMETVAIRFGGVPMGNSMGIGPLVVREVHMVGV